MLLLLFRSATNLSLHAFHFIQTKPLVFSVSAIEMGCFTENRLFFAYYWDLSQGAHAAHLLREVSSKVGLWQDGVLT